jgi:hypothetical protein
MLSGLNDERPLAENGVFLTYSASFSRRPAEHLLRNDEVRRLWRLPLTLQEVCHLTAMQEITFCLQLLKWNW